MMAAGEFMFEMGHYSPADNLRANYAAFTIQLS
jgi:hypothetical protein